MERLCERPADRPTAWRTGSRFAVHLGLLFSAGAALVTLQLLHVRVAYHADVGLVFVGLVLVHLIQRRRTLARMGKGIARSPDVGRPNDPPCRIGRPALHHHPERPCVRDRGLEPGRTSTATTPRALCPVAPRFRDPPRSLPGGARLAPQKARAAVDHPIGRSRSRGPRMRRRSLSRSACLRRGAAEWRRLQACDRA